MRAHRRRPHDDCHASTTSRIDCGLCECRHVSLRLGCAKAALRNGFMSARSPPPLAIPSKNVRATAHGISTIGRLESALIDDAFLQRHFHGSVQRIRILAQSAALPILCNLLAKIECYLDRQKVEVAKSSFVKIVDCIVCLPVHFSSIVCIHAVSLFNDFHITLLGSGSSSILLVELRKGCTPLLNMSVPILSIACRANSQARNITVTPALLMLVTSCLTRCARMEEQVAQRITAATRCAV